jgi:hypothetical protein
MLDTLKDLLANTKLPAIDAVQMSDLLQYLFSTTEKTLRVQVMAALEFFWAHCHELRRESLSTAAETSTLQRLH